MSRRERFIRPTDDELRRLEEAHIAKQKLVESRKGLIAKTLQTQRKDSLVQILTKLCDENIHARWITEAELAMALMHATHALSHASSRSRIRRRAWLMATLIGPD
jgi:hypothetical protein